MELAGGAYPLRSETGWFQHWSETGWSETGRIFFNLGDMSRKSVKTDRPIFCEIGLDFAL